MDDWKRRARCDLRDAADIARRDHVRPQSLDSPDFAVAQPSCDVRLENIVSAGGTAAQMTFRHILDDEAEPGQQLFRLPHDPLSMLQ
jgi:hypothetical protein